MNENQKIIVVIVLAAVALYFFSSKNLFTIDIANYPFTPTVTNSVVTATVQGYATQQTTGTYWASLRNENWCNANQDLVTALSNGTYNGTVTWSSSKGSITTSATFSNCGFLWTPTQDQDFIVLYGCTIPSTCASDQNQQYSTTAVFTFTPIVTCPTGQVMCNGICQSSCSNPPPVQPNYTILIILIIIIGAIGFYFYRRNKK